MSSSSLIWDNGCYSFNIHIWESISMNIIGRRLTFLIVFVFTFEKDCFPVTQSMYGAFSTTEYEGQFWHTIVNFHEMTLKHEYCIGWQTWSDLHLQGFILQCGEIIHQENVQTNSAEIQPDCGNIGCYGRFLSLWFCLCERANTNLMLSL